MEKEVFILCDCLTSKGMAKCATRVTLPTAEAEELQRAGLADVDKVTDEQKSTKKSVKS